LEALQADPLVLEPADPRDQILDGAPQPIQPPDHEGVPGPQEFLAGGQPCALRHRAADAVDEDFFAAGARQGVLLERQVLLMGGDPGVADVHRSSCLVVKQLVGVQKYLNVVFVTLFIT
jgi:hypothetical protein